MTVTHPHEIAASAAFYKRLMATAGLSDKDHEASLGVIGNTQGYRLNAPLQESKNCCRSDIDAIEGKGLHVPDGFSLFIGVHFHPTDWNIHPSEDDLIKHYGETYRMGDDPYQFVFSTEVIGVATETATTLLFLQYNRQAEYDPQIPKDHYRLLSPFYLEKPSAGALANALSDLGCYNSFAISFRNYNEYVRSLSRLKTFKFVEALAYSNDDT